MIENSILKKYLLDELEEDVRHSVEEQMFTDDEVFQRLNVLDDELVEAYVRGELTSAQGQRLFRRLNSNDRGRRTLEFMVQLADRARDAHQARPVASAAAPPWIEARPSEPTSFWSEVAQLLRNFVSAPRAALVMCSLLAVLVTLPMLQMSRNLESLQSERAELSAKLSALEEAQGTPSLAPVQAAFALRPLVRADESRETQLRLAPATRSLELRLDPGGLVTYEEFRARLRTRGQELWQHDQLRSTETPTEGFFVPVIIPTDILSPGPYELILDGLAEDRYREVARYPFDFDRD